MLKSSCLEMKKDYHKRQNNLSVKHIPNVKCNDNGTPLISSMFEMARQNSHSDLLCIINADMILMPDFVEAAKQVAKLKDKFVLLSRRWDYGYHHADRIFQTDGKSKLRETVENAADNFIVPREAIFSSSQNPVIRIFQTLPSAAQAGITG